MKIQNFRRLSLADFPDIPEPFLNAINEQFEKLTTALQGNINFEDNFNQEERKISVLHNTPIQIELKRVRGRVKSVEAIENENGDAATVAWERVTAKMLRLTVLFAKGDKIAGKLQTATLRIIGE